MKLSNKLLIAVATITLVLPLSVVYIVASSSRVDAEQYTAMIQQEAKSLQVADQYMTTISSQPFKRITILGVDGTPLNIQLVKSDEFAIKVDRGKEATFVHKIDATGNLILDFKNMKDYVPVTLSLFSPEPDEISISDVRIYGFMAKANQVHIKAEKLSNLSFADETNISHLILDVKNSSFDISGKDRNELSLAEIGKLTLHSDSSVVTIKEANLQHVSLDANDSKILFDVKQGNVGHISALALSTKRKCEINIGNTTITTLSGNLSDETVTDIPVHYLRKLLNNK
ncbi:hypothetical protein [Sphingobacterium pedocola]|uniref:Auto-transporter adhesin head GIN domain-containing protein n=1 Tax=Sphingobacterium pedocola TaxID=2082722 RepID=A0ABR9T7X1_9SPHI|nr:hypothetical protein [Sphingobacterium pedocola]MBE8721092.1 hypothetical protein [Sphingobacterium pedocola]